jgi:bifunctional NMN adenylyltransferase/nudix hydrolase
MTKKYDTLIFIGRFQPVHNAHAEIIRIASTLAHNLIVIVGSANQPRTYKNPWTSAERTEMIQSVVNEVADPKCTVVIEHNMDTMYNDNSWAARIQKIVYKHAGGQTKIGIIGHKKDSSSFYLDMFPQWTFENVDLVEPLDATNIRGLYFRDNVNMNFIIGVVPASVFRLLDAWRKDQEHHRDQVIRERKFIEHYKKQFEHLPYAPVFVTADAVVMCAGHVLMIKRKAEPGRGLWALPGGFLNAKSDPSMESAAIRELREETGIKVPVPVLKGSITDSRVFDAVDRSARGRTITHAFKFELSDTTLPKVKGADDAEKAKWIPIAAIRSEECFEDHWEIIQHFLGA